MKFLLEFNAKINLVSTDKLLYFLLLNVNSMHTYKIPTLRKNLSSCWDYEDK